VAKEVAKTEKKEGLKHCQDIITNADVKIDFRNKNIKAIKNE
jgi:hypothetical protein